MNDPVVYTAGIRDVSFGKNVRVVMPSNLYECTLGDDCFVGPFVEIQKGATIGARTKVQSHAFICEMVTIGENCFISHGAKFINDTFSAGAPSGGDKTKWKPTHLGNRVSIGTNATILPVTIADDVVVGAGAVVTKDLLIAGTYVGNPARLLSKEKTIGSSLSRSFLQFLKSFSSGGISAATNLAVTYGTVEYLKFPYALSILAAFIVANAINFVLQSTIFVGAFSYSSRAAGLFIFLSVLNLASNEIAGYVLVGRLHIWYLLAQALIILGLSVINFFVYRNIIFISKTPRHNSAL